VLRLALQALEDEVEEDAVLVLVRLEGLLAGGAAEQQADALGDADLADVEPAAARDLLRLVLVAAAVHQHQPGARAAIVQRVEDLGFEAYERATSACRVADLVAEVGVARTEVAVAPRLPLLVGVMHLQL